MKKYLIAVISIIVFSGCAASETVAIPFQFTGEIVNSMAPNAIRESISGTGHRINTVMPF